jgi:hypothetical protein
VNFAVAAVKHAYVWRFAANVNVRVIGAIETAV